MTALALLLCLQQEFTIGRTDPAKTDYIQAARKCREALACLESDPKRATELLDGFLGNNRISKRECRLRVEQAPGDLTDWSDFFPHQFRGRARLRLAESADAETAESLLAGAVADFEESVKRGLASSEPLLKDASERLAKLQRASAPRTDAEAEFAAAWRALIDAHRYAAARAHVQSKGKFLSEAARKRYLDDAEQSCRDFVSIATEAFLVSLEDVRSVNDLAEMKSDRFARAFALPPPAELIVRVPAYDWCAAMRPVCEQLKEGKDVLDGLLARALAAVPLVERGENRWFLATERLAFALVHERIEACGQEAQDAPAARRRELRARADAQRSAWAAFEAKLKDAVRGRPDFLERVPVRDLTALLERFPVDAEGVDALVARLDRCVHTEDPERELAEIERQWRNLWSGRARFTRESRVSIGTHLAVTYALRGLLGERTIDQIAADLQDVAAELRKLGGPMETDAFGPRVRDLLDRLRR